MTAKTKKVDTNLATFEAELQPLTVEVLSLKEQAEKFEIKTDEDYAKAGDLAGVVNEKKKAIDKMRKFFVDPLNAQVKSINGMFNPKVDEADEIVRLLKGKMSFYFDKKEEARLKEEKRLQDIRDKANAKREAEGKELITEPVREVAEVQKTVTTETAQSQVRKVWSHEIISINALPEDIKKAIFEEAWRKGIVTSVVQKFVDAGMREISGVKVFEKSIIALKKGSY